MNELIEKLLDAMIAKAAERRLKIIACDNAKDFMGDMRAAFDKQEAPVAPVPAQPTPRAPTRRAKRQKLTKSEKLERKKECQRRWYEKKRALKHEKDPGLAAAEANARAVRTADDIP